jgi:hypothetical protein
VRLFVDDVRTPPPGWRVARTVKEAVDLLSAETFEEVSLDFVIGYSEADNFAPVARFIVSLPPERRPRRVLIHTSSDRGARLLASLLEGHVREVVRRV